MKAEGKKVANRVGRVTSGGEVSDISPGREDASPTSIGQSANALLHAFDSLLSCAQSHGATRNDRAFEKLRAQLDDSVVRYFRSDRKCLRKPTTKKKFLEQLSFGNAGQDETRGLRIVRGALREKGKYLVFPKSLTVCPYTTDTFFLRKKSRHAEPPESCGPVWASRETRAARATCSRFVMCFPNPNTVFPYKD
jgi:hypothetical protein